MRTSRLTGPSPMGLDIGFAMMVVPDPNALSRSISCCFVPLCDIPWSLHSDLRASTGAVVIILSEVLGEADTKQARLYLEFGVAIQSLARNLDFIENIIRNAEAIARFWTRPL